MSITQVAALLFAVLCFGIMLYFQENISDFIDKLRGKSTPRIPKHEGWENGRSVSKTVGPENGHFLETLEQIEGRYGKLVALSMITCYKNTCHEEARPGSIFCGLCLEAENGYQEDFTPLTEEEMTWADEMIAKYEQEVRELLAEYEPIVLEPMPTEPLIKVPPVYSADMPASQVMSSKFSPEEED